MQGSGRIDHQQNYILNSWLANEKFMQSAISSPFPYFV